MANLPLTTAPINATSTCSGSVRALKHITSGSVAATSTVSGSIVRVKKLLPTNILATSTATAFVLSSNIFPATILATSHLSEKINILTATVPAGFYGVSDTEDGII